MKAKRPAGTNFLFSAILFSLFLFFSGLNAKGQSTCVQSGTGVWQNYAFATQSSQFVVTYSATPSHAAMTGEVGFSVNAASSLTNLALIVRFASTGAIDVRNGGSFSAATSYPYTAGTQYAFQTSDQSGDETLQRVRDGAWRRAGGTGKQLCVSFQPIACLQLE